MRKESSDVKGPFHEEEEKKEESISITCADEPNKVTEMACAAVLT